MTARDRAIHELHCRLEDAEAHLAELERENYGIPDRAVEAQEHKIQTIEDRLDTLNRKENRLMIRSGLLVAVLLCLVAIVTPQAYAAPEAPASPSTTLSVAYGCDQYAVMLGAFFAGPRLPEGIRSIRRTFYQRYGPMILGCSVRVEGKWTRGCDLTFVLGGTDVRVTGWSLTEFRCS